MFPEFTKESDVFCVKLQCGLLVQGVDMCIVREGWSEDGVTLPGALTTGYWINVIWDLGQRCGVALVTAPHVHQHPTFTAARFYTGRAPATVSSRS